MEVVFEGLDHELSFLSLLYFETDSKLEGEVVLFDLSCRNELDILTEDRLRYHRVF